MRLGTNPEVEKFRAEFAAFLDEHLPAAGEARERTRSSSRIPEWSRRWQRTLFDAGWLLPGQPPEYGGRNAPLEQGSRIRRSCRGGGSTRASTRRASASSRRRC